MKNLTKLTLGALTLSFAAAQANAETFNATAEISNAISLTETTPFSIGTVFITKADGTIGDNADAGATDAAQINIDALTGAVTTGNGTTDTGDGAVTPLGGEQVGVLTVTGAAPFADLVITATAPTAANDLVHSSANPAIPTINFLALTAIADDADNGGTLTLDASGNGNILIGGEFGASDRATFTGTYADGTYTGTYSVSVSY